MEICLDGAWDAVYHRHSEVLDQNIAYTTAAAVQAAPGHLRATVPGNFELDLVENGILPDLYFGENILKVQDYEDTHWWYATTFSFENSSAGAMLCFEGIDTIADIYVNGKLVTSTDNMLISHEFDISQVVESENSLVVHLKPVSILARQNPLNVGSQAHKYWYEGIRVRKAVHMYGWDIMPRAVSAGIWRSVFVKPKKQAEIEEFYIYPIRNENIQKYAALSFFYRLRVDERENMRNYSIRVKGVCKDSTFEETQNLLFNGGKFRIGLENPYLWYPSGRGEQNLYAITVELLKQGEVVDTYKTRLGIRSLELIRTSVTDMQGSGEFCFCVNGEKVFMTGTNWVPLDAFHSQDKKRLQQALETMDALHCNMVRCWGGNVYEDHAFFDFCDEKGILVWQDFSMACAIYPQDDEFAGRLYQEAEKIIKKLRQHPSLALWVGDNECDLVYMDWEKQKDPNSNRLTRQVLPQAIADHDPVRPYLPSSPYIDEVAFKTGTSNFLPEHHMWGERSYYKSDFYKHAMAHFASEQGYPGCPAPQSLKKFLSEDQMWPNRSDAWILHGTSPDATPDAPYGNASPFYFRTGVMADEIGELFGEIPDTLVRFAVASQLVQAEAMKFFVEMYRIGKGRRTGIMWWNLLDGWPQISEAVVDYYFCHKQAFYALEMSQRPVCLMFGEMQGWGMQLYGINDRREARTVKFCVTDLFDSGAFVAEGEATLPPDSAQSIAYVPFSVAKQALFLIEWESEEGTGRNYYLAGNPRFDLDRTATALIQSGLFKAEGFESDLLSNFKEETV